MELHHMRYGNDECVVSSGDVIFQLEYSTSIGIHQLHKSGSTVACSGVEYTVQFLQADYSV